jgi:hypothetical protein
MLLMPALHAGKLFRDNSRMIIETPTIYHSTNHRVNFAFLRRVCGSEACAQCWGEVLLDGLEGANGRRATEVGAGAQDPATNPSY